MWRLFDCGGFLKFAFEVAFYPAKVSLDRSVDCAIVSCLYLVSVLSRWRIGFPDLLLAERWWQKNVSSFDFPFDQLWPVASTAVS